MRLKIELCACSCSCQGPSKLNSKVEVSDGQNASLAIHTSIHLRHIIAHLPDANMAADISDEYLGKTYLYHQLDEYAWDEDEEFQGGLRAILGSVQDPAQVDHLTLRAKCYYYARKSGTPVDFDGYKQWVEGLRNGVTTPTPTNGTATQFADPGSEQASVRSEQSATASADGAVSGMSGMGNAPYSASFAEICDMIAEGKPIPGIKDIPDTILEGQASESQTQGRKKPWEKEAEAESEQEKPSWMRS